MPAEHRHVSGGKNHVAGCPGCLELNRAARARHAERNPGARLAYRLRDHGMTPVDYEAFVVEHGARCGVCRRKDPGGAGEWHIDHDHACCPTGRSCARCRRGLLCAKCNPGLGFFDDDPALLEAAAEYLRAAEARLAAGAPD